ncbi:JAB domain-containing protein [Seonamhaeicola aphaedonensis]|uniref:RadC-like JAB domain-containing protein n=1 Tax=Seonamhaeicola aphaedonensis TaxID=1461338 RepID=A0A3D9HH34_9FLAO|nr:JAB domain-containing protein [Seonamhaeicola aphaedonensis]RED48798.1 RadC-like JAB domain-containing protein [Seonamhaeicola aphaedonensis]
MKHSIAEIKVNYTPRKLKSNTKITCSQKAYEVLLESWDKGTLELQEEFKILLLNNSNEPLGLYALSKGGITCTPVDLKIMFGVILKSAATGFISVHNHPSGKLRPSNQDLALHKKVKKIANFHEINYLDNLIITAKNGYYSFQDEGDF